MGSNHAVFGGTSGTRPILRISLEYSSYSQAGNYSTWYWWVRYEQNGSNSWQATPASTWSMSDFAVASGSWTIPSAWAGTSTILYLGGPGYFTKGHDANGYLAAGNMFAYGAINNSTLVTDAYVGVWSGAPPRIPKAPSQPPAPTFVSAESNFLVFQVNNPADNGGSAITSFLHEVRSADGSVLVASWRASGTPQTTPSGVDLDPSTQYQVRVQARNDIGDSAWSPVTLMTTESGFYISDGVNWVGTRMLVSDSDVWVSKELFVSTGSAWVLPE